MSHTGMVARWYVLSHALSRFEVERMYHHRSCLKYTRKCYHQNFITQAFLCINNMHACFSLSFFSLTIYLTTFLLFFKYYVCHSHWKLHLELNLIPCNREKLVVFVISISRKNNYFFCGPKLLYLLFFISPKYKADKFISNLRTLLYFAVVVPPMHDKQSFLTSSVDKFRDIKN